MRFMVTPWFTIALAILSESTSPIFFCSAFATAESRTCFTIRAACSGVKLRMLSHLPPACPYKIYDLSCLTRRDPYMPCCCARFHYEYPLLRILLYFAGAVVFSAAALEPPCPLNVRVGENSPSL